MLPSTRHYWRIRYKNTDNAWSLWSNTASFTTANTAAVNEPMLSAIGNASGAGVGMTPTLSGSAFSVNTGSDAQVSSDWEIWTGNNGTGTKVWSSSNDAVNKTNIVVPSNTLSAGTVYYARVRYNGTAYGLSPWSPSLQFKTALVFPPSTYGAGFAGGYYAGLVTVDNTDYAIVLAPKSLGETSTALTSDNGQAWGTSLVDSATNTDALLPNGVSAPWVKNLVINGYNDWKIPAKTVLETIAANLRQSAGSAPAVYKSGGSEALSNTVPYWSSTTNDRDNGAGTVYHEAYATLMGASVTSTSTTKTTQALVRAVRLVPIT
jgi:hypothetical protein